MPWSVVDCTLEYGVCVVWSLLGYVMECGGASRMLARQIW